MAVVRAGEFVEVNRPPYNRWGIGKIVSLVNGSALVQYFAHPGSGGTTTIECRTSDLRRATPPTQTRVWRRHHSGRWQVGRMLSHDGASAYVQFPNVDRVTLDTDELFVRWNKPLDDPLSLLIAEATESPFLADPRSAFVRETSRQRSSSSGLTALLGASIELESYQFDVVRRVLTDPVQRYLLADEVGLGKTIEAGVIIRQHFLDKEDARAVVLTPPTLTSQWRKELTCRFGLSDSLDDFLHVVSFDDPERLDEVLPDTGLLVVDEAHHLSRLSTDLERQLFRKVQHHSRRIPKLLLLSATPVLADEEGFLRVLHLLDPVVFPLDDLAGFKQRIASRELVAEVAAALAPENLWGLGPELDRLEQAYKGDQLLCERIGDLRVVLDRFPDEEDEEYLSALRSLKTHLLESYRLHRRMLRHRRSAIPWATVGRDGCGLVTWRSGHVTRTAQLWDELRFALNESALDPDGVLMPALLECAANSSNSSSIAELLNTHGLHDISMQRIASDLDNARRRNKEDATRIDTLVKTVQDELRTAGLQIVVFCDQEIDANRCHEALKSHLGELVERHRIPVDDDSATPLSWERFLTMPELVRVLVCDRRAEEGVNLHGGIKCAIHFDLPVAPNRIEQRMGRLDRFGKGKKVRSIVLIDEANEAEVLWADVLMEGWKVFNQSVASLQYLIEEAGRKLAQQWLHHGNLALAEHLTDLQGTEGLVEREFQLIDRHDALDALSEPDDASIDNLEDCDSDWRTWRDAFRELSFTVLNFQERRVLPDGRSDQEDRPFRIGYTHRDDDRPTLLPMTSFLQHFLQSVDLDARGSSSRTPLSHPYVFSRAKATPRTSLANGVRLLRVGDPIVTALENFCQQDDRGRAFAVWRVDRDHVAQDASGVDLYFRFDFVAAPTMPDTEHSGSAHDSVLYEALKRKATRLMPPCFLRIWVDGNGNVVTEPSATLTAPYTTSWAGSRKDFNLNPERWRSLPQAARVAWMRDWGRMCNDRRDLATSHALLHPELAARKESALRTCNEEASKLAAQTASRLTRLQGAAREQEADDAEREQMLYGMLREAIGSATVRLDVVGAFFVATTTIEET